MYSGGKYNLNPLLCYLVSKYWRMTSIVAYCDSNWNLCLIAQYYRYDEAPIGQKPYRQKDGALLAVGALCDKLKQTEPYKLQLEQMLVQHVYPEFKSPVGHLRAKVHTLAFTTMTYHKIEGKESTIPLCFSLFPQMPLVNSFPFLLFQGLIKGVW